MAAPSPLELARHPGALLRFARDKARYGATFAELLVRSGALGAMRPAGALAMLQSALRGARDPNLFIHVNALNHPDRLAVIFERRRLTYAEFDRRIERLAEVLADAGVAAGDRVAVMMHNSSEYLEASAAATRLGGTVVPIGFRLRAQEVAYILSNSGARALVFDTALAEVIEEARKTLASSGGDQLLPQAVLAVSRSGESCPRFAREFEQVITAAPGPGRRRVAAGDAGVMVYTSGTTGRPKGAMRSLANTGWEPIVSLLLQLGMTRDDRHLVVCPLYHSLAGFFASFNLILGACVVVVSRFEAESCLKVMSEERVTTSAMVPTMLRRLTELPDEVVRRYPLPALRTVVSSAAPLPMEVARRVLDRFGPVLWNTYGASEVGLVTLASPQDLREHPGTIGRALPGNEIRLLDEEGRDVPEGEVGELFVGNETTIEGYHGNAEATQRARRHGLFSVGDMARKSPSGHYFLVDRKTDMVISGGVNIYPAEIEQTLHQHPQVAEAAVVGIPDEEWGESLAVFVVTRPAPEGAPAGPLTAEALLAFCRERLAGYKVPRQVVFVDELPRNPSGKVLKRELRERLRPG